MPNPLTGGFPAVLQVDGLTLDRLLASLHQNPAIDTARSSLPHDAYLRVGDNPGTIVDGVKGTLRAQIGCPRLDLIPDARDQVGLHGWLRAWHVADPGSGALPELMYGEFRCRYGAKVVGPFAGHGSEIQGLLFALLPGSVVYTSLTGDTSADAAITRQLEGLLANRYPATPHQVLNQIKDGKFRSIVDGAGSAMVHALEIGGSPEPSADLGAVGGIVLDGNDFAVAVSKEHILAMFAPVREKLMHPHALDFTATQLPGNPDYMTTITAVTVGWQAGGVLPLTIAGNTVTDSIYPNVEFRVNLTFRLQFTPPALGAPAALALVPDWPPPVWVELSSLGFAKPLARDLIRSVAQPYVFGAAVLASHELRKALEHKNGLIFQLSTVDPDADADFVDAAFTGDGVILMGAVTLSPREGMRPSFPWLLANKSGYSVMPAWMPGGRVLRYEWRWYWDPGPGGVSTSFDGTAAHRKTFLLRSDDPAHPVPGTEDIPSSLAQVKGKVCSTIFGVNVHPVTGLDVEIDNADWGDEICHYVVPPPPPPPSPGAHPWAVELGPRWWVLWSAARTADAADRVEAFVDADLAAAGGEPANMLLLHVSDPAAVASIGPELEAAGTLDRPEAGLLVVVAVGEGVLAEAGDALVAQLARAPEGLVVVTTVDVGGGWAASLDIPPDAGQATRLVSPDGRIAWRQDGDVTPEAIAEALVAHLAPAPPPSPVVVQGALPGGTEAPLVTLDARPGMSVDLPRLRGRTVTLAFVDASAPSEAVLGRLERTRARREAQGETVIAVVRDTDGEGALALRGELGGEVLVVADPHGELAASFAVCAWPTLVTIDPRGVIAAVRSGADPGALEARVRRRERATAGQLEMDDD